MATVIDLRLRRLEKRLPVRTHPDISRMTTEELTAELLQIERAVLADPDATDESRRHAAALLSLPWGETRKWTVDELVTFCREANWEG